jgi:hypothetical protein
VWLSPELVKLDERVSIVVNGQRVNSSQPFVEPDLETMLEDIRTRADRQHPFWAKIEAPTGRFQASRR